MLSKARIMSLAIQSRRPLFTPVACLVIFLVGLCTPSVEADELAVVGPAEGILYTKLGTQTHRTMFLLEGGFTGLAQQLEEDDFYKAIVGRVKRTDTTLLVKNVSKKKIIKSILKQSKRVRKDHKDFYTKQDTKNLEAFLESVELAKEYFHGTRFVVESGKGDRKPAYIVYGADGKMVSRSEVTDAKHIESIRKFLNYQEHWFDHYERGRR
ncbi:MAG: hypothetical protein CMJ65_12685 [Planctomycetaceae bacterium]|jgi:hypothetical protein|nr:hypothetical protein [Planctomycetaceae bacterium]MDP7276865.1 hypothetical protein [Planctomycetaceae bacterium]